MGAGLRIGEDFAHFDMARKKGTSLNPQRKAKKKKKARRSREFDENPPKGIGE